MSKTIWQLDPASALSLTDKIEVSQSNSPSSTSVFGTLEQLMDNIVKAGFTEGSNMNFDLSTPGFITVGVIDIPFFLGLGIGFSGPLESCAIFQIDSATKGILPPAGNLTQRNAIGSPLESLLFYNKTFSTLDYYGLGSWQTLLNTQNVNGTGTVTVTDNGDGTIDIFGSGGGSAPAPSFASYSVINNLAARPATAIFGAVPVSSGFNDISDENFTSQTMIIAGVTTVGSTYIGTVTNNFIVNQACVLRSTDTASLFREYTYAVAILRADSSIETTLIQGYTNNDQTPLFPGSVSMSGMVELSPGDTIFTQVVASSTDARSPTYYITSQICSAAGSIPDPVTLSGSSIIGNIPQFNNTTGQVIDSGISVLGFANGDWTPVFTNLVGISGGVGVVSSRYLQVGKIVIISQSLQLTATDSTIQFTTSIPVIAGFTSASQASLMGQSFSTEGAFIGDGTVINAISNASANTISVLSIAAVGSGVKIINYSAMYEVQS